MEARQAEQQRADTREEAGKERGKSRGEGVSGGGSVRRWEEAEQLWYLEQL